MHVFTLDKFSRNVNADCFSQWKTVTIQEFPNGVEVLINEGAESCSDGSLYVEVEVTARGEADEEKAAQNRDRAARRAKTQVRRKCKMIQADAMLTLTYRENMTDRNRLASDYKEFVRRLRSVGPFEYVACVEEQKRGALHMHIACQHFPAWMKNADGVKVKSYNLIRSIWRSVVGRDNGNVDLTKPRRNGAHRIACYIAKYVSKGLEDTLFNAKSYWASKGIPKPKKIVLRFNREDSTFDIIALVFDDLIARGFTDISQYRDKLNEFYWFAASRP